MSGDEHCCDELFEWMVESVGIKAFAAAVGISTRQVHRMLNGAQPNPVQRFCDVMDAADPDAADAVLSHICQQHGAYWVRIPEDVTEANLNAVKEAAEAIVAISEGQSTKITISEIREAIAALTALERELHETSSEAVADV